MKDRNWKKIDNNLVRPTRLPGVFERKGGGYVVRARVKDPMTGRMREIKKVLDDQDERAAYNWLEEEKSRIRLCIGSASTHKPRFGDFAVSLLEKKIATRDLRSALTEERWKHALVHLIAGTTSPSGDFVPGFGELAIDEIRIAHVDRWKVGHAGMIERGEYSPNTVNGWLSILRVILKAASREFELPRTLVEDIANFDASDHVTYSEEEPQSLTPAQVKEFLALMRTLYPQHYAMTFLGLCTGLRPSSLRPLRRRGEQADVLWDKGRLLVRRSQTRGERVLETTKQRTRYNIALPEEAVAVLRWHVETQLETDEQRASDLLFPAINGAFRSPSVLNKPFEDVSSRMGLGYTFTQRGMRRTFNDLARAAHVGDLVTRSISGHATPRMQAHYSTVGAEEQASGLAKVIDLLQVRAERADQAPSGATGGATHQEVVRN